MDPRKEKNTAAVGIVGGSGHTGAVLRRLLSRHPSARLARPRRARFDVYEGDQVPPDKRSLALRVVMRSPERTLSEKDIAGVRAKIVGALARDGGAALR